MRRGNRNKYLLRLQICILGQSETVVLRLAEDGGSVYVLGPLLPLVTVPKRRTIKQ